MALKKVISTPQGYTAEYWRVCPNISVDFANLQAQAGVVLYANSTARQAEKSAVEIPVEQHMAIHEVMSLSGTDFSTALATGDLRAAFYAKLKALSFFVDAEDC